MVIKSGIYIITNNISNDRYIGSSKNLTKRKNSHFRKLKLGIHPNLHMQSSYNKYGEDVFIFNILEECNNLLEREQYYIDLIRPEFNKRIIASSNLGSKFSEQARKNMSNAMKKEGNNFYGRKHSQSSKDKMRLAKLGVKTGNRKLNRGKSVKQYDKDIFIKEYENLKIAAIENGFNYKYFIEKIKKSVEFKGYNWHYNR